MSVLLFKSKEARKIANSLPEFYYRSIWYSYISNVTAYNLQYQENELIDFDGWDTDEKYTDPKELSDAVASLVYNMYTNDGNYFMPELHRQKMEDKSQELKFIYQDSKSDVTNFKIKNYVIKSKH